MHRIMIRKLQFNDRSLLQGWIAEDPWHKDTFLPEFWYEKDRISFIVEDDLGPALIVKLVPEPPAMRLFIQFGSDQKRSAKAMLSNFDQVKSWVQKTGASSIIFESTSSTLIAFCKKAFKFNQIEDKDDYQLILNQEINQNASTQA